MRLLLVEDDRPLAAIVRQGLQEAGYTVELCGDGASGLERALSGEFDLLILDVMLPRVDGWTICREVRAREEKSEPKNSNGRALPILMLTARDAVDDRVHGLEIGADDYLIKPFDFKELRARVRALLRREVRHESKVLHVGALKINTEAQQVWRGAKEIHLTPREYALLALLARHAGCIITREAILNEVWKDGDVAPNSVDVYINFLRHKIDDGHDEKLIHTEHRRGYVLRAPQEK